MNLDAIRQKLNGGKSDKWLLAIEVDEQTNMVNVYKLRLKDKDLADVKADFEDTLDCQVEEFSSQAELEKSLPEIFQQIFEGQAFIETPWVDDEILGHDCQKMGVFLTDNGDYAHDDIENEVIDILAEHLGGDRSIYKPNVRLDKLGMDSMDCVEFVMALEETFDIVIDEEEYDSEDNALTIAQVINIVKEKI